MISVKINTKDLVRDLDNSVDYSKGFLEGVEVEKITFMRFLAGFTREGLYKYIDSRARINPSSLHHVYEPNQVGNENSRLYSFDAIPSIKRINFVGTFLPSSIPSSNSKVPFVDKANIMENGISITITPKNSETLVFENDGELVFTRNSITIDHPGGDQVAGAFGEVVDQFFTQYLTNALLKTVFDDLKTADEFIKGFGKGRRAEGMRAGRKYLSVTGVDFA